MASTFHIVLNIKTPAGFQSFAEFNVCNDRKAASKIFGLLKGDRKVNEKNVLQLDLRENSNGLPVNIELLTCTLEELAENCRIITKEIFKYHTLE